MATTTAREHLEWATKRALEYYDMAQKVTAIASFMSDVSKHDDTAWIQDAMYMRLLEAEYDRGRDSFERFMLGFNVV